MPDRWYRVLLGAAACYLVLLPTNLVAFWRSVAFAIAALATAVVLTRIARTARPVRPSPSFLACAFIAWAVWTLATAVWSVDPAKTLGELKSDLGWSIATLGICYVAAATRSDGFRVLAGSLLAGLAFWAALATGLALSSAGWDGRLAHWALGVYTTWLVTAAPFVLLLVWAPPDGFGDGVGSVTVALLLTALIFVTSYLADARVVWLAFAAALATALACAPRTRPRRRMIWAGAGLIVICAAVFVHTAQERVEVAFPAGTSLGESVSADPRLAIWQGALERIRERPLAGHGYGLQILAERMRTVTTDPLVTHPHNLFIGQWLQTGAIGVGLFALVGILLAWRYVSLVRSGDAALARLGTLGLMVLAGFVVRNFTDDFFLRANAKLLFAVNGLLLGAAALRGRSLPPPGNA